MAGSYNHIVDEKGDLITNEEFTRSIENLGDAYKAAKECWYIIQILAQGDKSKVTSAQRTMYQMLNHKYR